MTIQPYQYQLSGITFGRNTDVPLSKAEVQAYNVNNQDFQVPKTDEIRFGIDTLAPAPIVFTGAVMDNFALEQLSHLGPPGLDDLFALRGTLLGQLAQVWKAKATRFNWNSVIPMLYCRAEGDVLRIYGRPGKFQYGKRMNDRETWIDVQAEFRRGDTYAYSDIEYYVNSGQTAGRLDGDADSWLRILIEGPSSDPVVTYGSKQVHYLGTIPSGVIVEISSYPWSRRVVDSMGVNQRTKVPEYLDTIMFPAGGTDAISLSGGGTVAFCWREAWNVI